MKSTTSATSRSHQQKIVPSSPLSNNQVPWTVKFEHLGRTYSIYKRHKTRSAPYQFCVIRHGKRTRQSLETNNQQTALDRAKAIIDKATAGKWQEIERVKVRRPGQAPIAKLFRLYPIVAQVSPISIRNNIGSMKWLIECANCHH